MPEPGLNHFAYRSAAARYAAARPYFHPIVVARIVAFTGSSWFERALDVGCGTGQSARAVAQIARAVEAIDISADMIAHADPHPRVRYHVAPAERMPFPDAQFDLATVGLAFHWFDQQAFLREAARVLKSGGWLVIYNHGFNGEMNENADFRRWAWEVYPKRFPAPPRGATVVNSELVTPHSFELIGSEKFANDESMSAEQLTAYLLTQTNVIAAVEAGTTPLAEAAEWIASGVSPFFNVSNRTMKFGGTIWYLRQTR
jgi:SAM-dependent methyltransferase